LYVSSTFSIKFAGFLFLTSFSVYISLRKFICLLTIAIVLCTEVLCVFLKLLSWVVLLVLFCSRTLCDHDFWISFEVLVVGSPLSVSFCVFGCLKRVVMRVVVCLYVFLVMAASVVAPFIFM
ncbi:hypothetical protein L9F63_007063, partial [Diploptera punctata]